MCGIAGVLHLDGQPVAPEVLAAMASSIAHRGPDDSGMWLEGPVGLANRRLAVIDLSSAGHQPMTTEDGDVVLTYNGEIFNFQELRQELAATGHRFRSRTDSEVVAHAFAEWGEEAVRRFNGQFAFAIWQRRRRRLFLARDRFGIKPLYYLRDARRIVFASEIRAILAHPGVARQLSYAALDEYFTFQNILGDHTLFEGIRLLPPATWMLIDAEDTATVREYWNCRPSREADPCELTTVAAELRQRFESAVRRQLVSDVPVGSYLSGGMDSGSVAAVAHRALGGLRTFTLGFDLTRVRGTERSFDEREAARATAQLLGTEHHEAVLGPRDMERSLPDVIRHLEELRVGQSYPNYAVAAFARHFVKVVLSGTGGDELFAGYPWRYAPALTASGADDFRERYYRWWQRLVSDEEKGALFRPEVPRGPEGSTFAAFQAVLECARVPLRDTADFVDASLYFDFKTFLHGLLVVEDKVSMAHALEVRVPFLDNDLVDLALRLPPSLKIRNGVSAGQNQEGAPTRDGKLVLRAAMRPLLGDEVVERPKRGFSAPDTTWFRGASRAYVRDVLLDPGARIYEVLQADYVRRNLEEHWAGSHDRRLLIWSLLAFEEWLRQFDVAT